MFRPMFNQPTLFVIQYNTCRIYVDFYAKNNRKKDGARASETNT